MTVSGRKTGSMIFACRRMQGNIPRNPGNVPGRSLLLGHRISETYQSMSELQAARSRTLPETVPDIPARTPQNDPVPP
jgi:hypothetical protein